MKKMFVMFALLIGAVSVQAQSNDLFSGYHTKIPLRANGRPLWRSG